MDPLGALIDPLGTLIDWIAVYGIVGLVAIGVAERFVPVLPSYGVLVAIGIAAADGSWSVTSAVIGTVAGSLAGCLLLYGLAIALSERRTHRLLAGVGRLAGMSPKRVDSAVSSFRAYQRALAFGTQLVPTVRLVSPVIAGLFRADARAFAIASLAGITVWNALFISVGHLAAAIAPTTSASTLALQVLILLIVAEVLLALGWRWLRRPASDGMAR
ncbi:MAG TPA: VTT domain-containing protein [Inquilinus sp.]|nr:VTT domain-containing protein [Inquilinus sp.]